MSEPKLVARLFARGPFVRAGGPRGPGRLIAVSGKVDAAEGVAYAVAALPVIAKGDRWVPADPEGRESTVEAVVKLPEVRVDRSLAFELQLPAAWWAGVEGVLMALIYDLDLGSGVFSYYQLLQIMGAERAGAPPVSTPMREALEGLLGETVAKLRTGIVKIAP